MTDEEPMDFGTVTIAPFGVLEGDGDFGTVELPAPVEDEG